MNINPERELHLYHERSSSCSWRVRIALAYKGIDYESHLIEWASGELQSEAHRTRSPFGQVPCIEIDGQFVSQSVAILELLEELYAEPRLLPTSPIERANIRELVEAVNAGIQPLHNGGLRVRMHEQFAAGGEAHDSWARYWLERRFGELESLLARRSNGYAFGNQLSLADVVLYPQLCKAIDYQVGLETFPTLAALHAQLGRLAAFAGTGSDSV